MEARSREAIIDHLCRFEPACLNITATVQALMHAVEIQAHPAADLLQTYGDPSSWRPRHVPAPLPRWPLTWVEWTAPTESGHLAMGALFSTERTPTGYEAEVVAFADHGPFLRHVLTFDPDGDLTGFLSAPLFASLGGGMLMVHQWEQITAQAWTNRELLCALEWSCLAAPLLALSLSNLSAAAPGLVQIPETLMARLTAGESLFRAVGDLYHAEPIQAPLVAAGPLPYLWALPNDAAEEWACPATGVTQLMKVRA